MNDRKTWSLETWLFVLAFLLALGLRCLLLNHLPLNDAEAVQALEALSAAGSSAVTLTGAPAYTAPASALMAIFGAGDGLARFWPAVVGAGMALLPLLFRRWLGRVPAIILAFFIALDPVLISASRQANASVLAAAFLLAAVGFICTRKWSAAGIFAGLALAGGEYFWFGAVVLGLAVLILWGIGSKKNGQSDEEPAAMTAFDGLRFSISLAAAFVLYSTRMLTLPQGLSAAFSGLPEFLQGFGAGSTISRPWILFALASTAPLAVILGFVRGITGLFRRDPVDRRLVIGFLTAMSLLLVYPGRSALNLVWAVIPLWALSARLVANFNLGEKKDRMARLIQASLTFTMIIFCWLVNLGNMLYPSLDITTVQYLAVTIVSLLLIVAATILVAYGWTPRAALSGLCLGLGLVAVFISLSNSWRATGLGIHPEAEVVSQAPVVDVQRRLLTTLDEFSRWNKSGADALDIVLLGIDRPSLKWALRDYPNVLSTAFLAAGNSPDAIITLPQEIPALVDAYRGQKLTWQAESDWKRMTSMDWLRWFAFRESVLANDELIVWVRNDLFK